MLTTPQPKEVLYVYLSTSKEAVSAVLMAERKGRQCLVHYVSMALHDAERNYALLEKVPLALLHTSRRLRRYFEAHPITFITDQSIKQILNKAEASRMLAKYSVELGAYNITYEPRMGHGCARTITRSSRKGEVCDRSNRLLHQMDEAKPLAKTTGKEVKKFVWDNIVHSFGLPRIIVTDNGTNVFNDPFKSWCKQLNIQQINTAVAHPQANDLVKRVNRSLMEGIKTRLGRERKGWVDELPNVLWAHQTSLKPSNGETPYSLTIGSEEIIPKKIGMPTHRTMTIKEGTLNEEEIRLNLDLLQERRETAAIREAMYKMKMEQYYNKRARPTAFKVGEYVYRRNEASRVENLGKLGPKWEGPYLVTEAYQNGSYKLETIAGREVPRTWHAINLRKCYLEA
ncbi:reverse transcriptase domain-containing protein [Tanacetum coccineum]|uniref:Reverse transcriptase domain-containing protein n=1 Tax=Tanacetum coccineum TaxID=301880 RepID=A0ABQ5FQE3_9ASTR